MCHLTRFIPPHTLNSATGADLIFHKPVFNGVLYVLKFKDGNEKQHSTVNNNIVLLDKTLKLKDNTDTTLFLSINDDVALPGSMVLSFKNDKRKSNPLYTQLFDRRDVLLPGVNVWNRDAANVAVLPEFDVVKKRRAMDDPDSKEDGDSSAEALASFEDFEANVLSALESIRDDEFINCRMEMIHMEDDLSMGKVPTTGGVYFAWSACLNCMKIGATRRESALPRLQELSRHVTTPFVLVSWLPSPTPFRKEAAAHAHFATKRINTRGSGAGTEFFNISAAEAEGWVAAAMVT